MKSLHSQNQSFSTPLDMLINLIAEIEVEKYLKEINNVAEQDRENDSSNLR